MLGRPVAQRPAAGLSAGTVDVVEFMTVRRYSHIMHLESTVVGDIRPGQSATTCSRDVPAGTLSGAPNLVHGPDRRAEPSRRGIYGGVVGYLDFHGDLDMAIAIRTAVIKDGRRTCRPVGDRRRLGARLRVRGERQQGRGRPASRRFGLGVADAMIDRSPANGPCSCWCS
jgi:hypothetical protein